MVISSVFGLFMIRWILYVKYNLFVCRFIGNSAGYMAVSYMEGIMGKQVDGCVGKSDILMNTGFRFLFGQVEK